MTLSIAQANKNEMEMNLIRSITQLAKWQDNCFVSVTFWLSNIQLDYFWDG
jgi:hypothetical protein